MTTRAMKVESNEAFTLLEVMVAIAILALSLTAIFSSEAGAVKMAARARKMGLASLLVRCKMGEIEEEIANKGLPALFATGSDACCKEGEIEGFSCNWEIEPVLLPDNMFMGQAGDKKTGAGSTTGTQSGAAAGPLAAVLGAATSAKAGGTQQAPDANPLDAIKNIDPTQVLSGGGVGGIAAMALSFVYPVLKPAFEAQIRRATVTVRWKEGSVTHSFDVTQYLVADQAMIPGIDPATGQPIPGQQPGAQPGQTLPGQAPAGLAPATGFGFPGGR